MYRNLLIYLTHPDVEAWNSKSRHRERILQAFPGLEVKICLHLQEFLKELPNAEVVIVWYFKKQWLEEANQLRMIATPAAGRDWIDVELDEKLKVIHGGFHGPMIAESVIGAMLYFCKAFELSRNLQSLKKWGRVKLSQKIRSLQGAKVTIFGFGKIGQEIGRKLKPFGCVLTGIKRRPAKVLPEYFGELDNLVSLDDSLEEILRQTDHLILTLPGGHETNGMMTRERLGFLSRDCYLYNVGRGNAYQPEDLVDALQVIAGAYLDVFESEPLPKGSPLWGVKNALIQPHLSAVSPQYLDLFFEEWIKNIKEGLI